MFSFAQHLRRRNPCRLAHNSDFSVEIDYSFSPTAIPKSSAIAYPLPKVSKELDSVEAFSVVKIFFFGVIGAILRF